MNNQAKVRLRSLPITAGKPGRAFATQSKATHQSGGVLIISLIMLLLLTLIGISGMQSTSLEEKMAGNMRDKNLAFQAAESALKAAEASLAPPPPATSFVDPGTGGLYSDTSTIPTAAAILTDGFWTANPVATYSATALGNGIVAPAYIIQRLPTANTYRITVRATGGSTNAVVILQSIYLASP